MARRPKTSKAPKANSLKRGVQKHSRQGKTFAQHSERLRRMFADNGQTDAAVELLETYAIELDPARPSDGSPASPAPVLKALEELPRGRREELLSQVSENARGILSSSSLESLPEPDLDAINSSEDLPPFDRGSYEGRAKALSVEPDGMTDQKLLNSVIQEERDRLKAAKPGILGGDSSKLPGRDDGLRSGIDKATSFEELKQKEADGLLKRTAEEARDDQMQGIIGSGASKELRDKTELARKQGGFDETPEGTRQAQDQLMLPRVVGVEKARRLNPLAGLGDQRASSAMGILPEGAAPKDVRRLQELKRHLAETGELKNPELADEEIADVGIALNNEQKELFTRLIDEALEDAQRRRGAPLPDGGRFETPKYQPNEQTLLTGTGGKASPNIAGNYSGGKTIDRQLEESSSSRLGRLIERIHQISQRNSGEVPTSTPKVGDEERILNMLMDDAVESTSPTPDMTPPNYEGLDSVDLDNTLPSWRQQMPQFQDSGSIKFGNAPTGEALARRIANQAKMTPEAAQQFVVEARDILDKSIREQAGNPPLSREAERSSQWRLVPGPKGKEFFGTDKGRQLNQEMFSDVEMHETGLQKRFTGDLPVENELDDLRREIAQMEAEEARAAEQPRVIDEEIDELRQYFSEDDFDPIDTDPPKTMGDGGSDYAPNDDLGFMKPKQKVSLKGLLA